MPAYASILVNVFPRIPAKVGSAFPRALLILPPPSHEFHPKEPLEVDTVPFECSIAGITRMVFSFMRNMKSKMMVAEAFVLFFTVTLEINGGI